MWWSRLKRFTAFSLYQIGIQGIGQLSGLMLVWLMPHDEYALLTVALSMSMTIHTLCDMGISTAVISIGGRVHHNRERFGALIASAMRARWWLALVVVPLLMPLMVILLRRAGADWIQVALAVALSLIGLGLDLRVAVLVRVLLLRGEVGQAQAIDLRSALVRISTIALAVATHTLSLALALGSDVLQLLARTVLLQRRLAPHVDLGAPAVESDHQEIRRLMRLQAANGIFFCIQGQLALWLLGFLGGHGAVADYGALGRFSFLVSFLSAMLTNILVPGVARLQDPETLVRRYRTILSGLTAVALALTGACWLFPAPALLLLGSQYHHLQAELPLMVGNLMISFLIGAVWSLNAARAWITASSLFNIPCTIAMQVAMAFAIDVTTVHGALLFSITTQLPNALLCAFDSWRGLRRFRLSPPAGPAAGTVAAGPPPP